MPHYLDDTVPRFGRRRAKDLKVYHVRKGTFGPSLISKFIWHVDSHYSRYKFLDDAGQLKKDANNHPYPSLVAAQNLLLESFNIPYSLNKRKRWAIMDIARKSISSIQNNSIGLRVSVYNHLFGNRSMQWYGNPESLVSYSYDDDMISEFHGSNNGSELHLKRRNMKFEDVFRKTVVQPKKRKQRFRRQKFPLLKLPRWMNERKQDKIDFEQRSTHVIFKQQSFIPTVRLLNMDPVRNPNYTNTCQENMRSRRAEKKRRSKDWKQKRNRKMAWHLWRRNMNATAQRTKTPSKRRCQFMRICEKNSSVVEIELKGYDETPQLMTDTDRELMECEDERVREHWMPKLGDFQITGYKQKRKSSKKKALISTGSSEYGCWLRSSPSLGHTAVEELEKETVVEAVHSEVTHYLPLPSFMIHLNEDEENFPKTAKQLLPHSNEIVGISPETFSSRIDDASDKLKKLIPELVDYQSGHIFLVRCLPCENVTSMRCIVNRDESANSDEKRFVPRTLRTCASFSRFIPYECFVASTSYTQEMADSVASAQLLSETQHKCEDLPSKSFYSSYCDICDSNSTDGFALRCAHFFCRECWVSHASSMLTSGIVPITCPGYGCSEVLKVEHLLMLLPFFLCERYKRMLANKCMLRPNWVHCANCTKTLFVALSSSRQYLAHCECGTALCLRCKQNVHPPLLCDEARQYFLVLDSNGQLSGTFDESRSVMVKRCPFCGSFCERIDGCNHMQCVCGQSFCYVCSKKWEDSYHYECSVDVSVRVNLFDVGIVNATHISLNTLDECLNYRRCRSASNLFLLAKKLALVLKHDVTAVRHVVSLYATVCEVLELNAIGIYQLRRRLRHSVDIRLTQRIAMMIGVLRCFEDRLNFLAKRVRTSCESGTTRPLKITELSHLIESHLSAYMNEVF